MTSVLLSVKPRFAEKILSGEKTCEFRRGQFPLDIQEVFVYSSSPEKRVVAMFRVKNVHTMKPREAWEKYNGRGGIDRNSFFSYYRTSDEAVCIEIGAVFEFKPRIDPRRLYRGFVAPQSFAYVSEPMRRKLDGRGVKKWRRRLGGAPTH